MHTYIHKVRYYETDKMGSTHHSNYIRWMEEARIDFLDYIGYGYAQLEHDGITSPVIGVECQYKHPTTFDDEVKITVGVDVRVEQPFSCDFYFLCGHDTGWCHFRTAF